MRRLPTALATTAAACMLTACGGGGNPEPAPLPESSTPSPTASASPTPPAMPAAARKKTKAGAIAFTRQYVALINHAQSTGDVASLRAVEGAACESCKQADAFLERLYESGGSIRGGDFVIRNVTALPNPVTRGWVMSLGVTFGPQIVDYPSPKTDERPKGGRLPLNLQIAWRANEWEVLQWSRGA